MNLPEHLETAQKELLGIDSPEALAQYRAKYFGNDGLFRSFERDLYGTPPKLRAISANKYRKFYYQLTRKYLEIKSQFMPVPAEPQSLDDVQLEFTAELNAAASDDELQAVRIKYFGLKGALRPFEERLRSLQSRDEKKAFGQVLNRVKGQMESAFNEFKLAPAYRSADFFFDELGGSAVVSGPQVDVTEPGRLSFDNYQPGVAHIITQTVDNLVELFARMGFTVAEGPEVEDDFHNFEALNIPRAHPARDPLDNFYLDRPSGAAPFMVRSQTSSVQIRVMETTKPPIRIVAPGRVYRPDTVDATHLFMFHQIEALVVDKCITMVDLRSTIDQFAKAFFGPTVETRFRPSFFPFTEPSAEVDVLVPQADGSSKWMEIGGCGMVDPNVFKSVGIDSDVYTGWAFGFGIERLAMRRHNITDIRDLVANDLRFLRQF